MSEVVIKPTLPSEHEREKLWASDPEIARLDPYAGEKVYTHLYSIYTSHGRHIGTCSAYDFRGSSCQIGIRIGEKDCWNKGYGTEVVKMLVDHYFTQTGIDHIWVKVLPENMRARRCYEKAGFKECGAVTIGGYTFVKMERRR